MSSKFDYRDPGTDPRYCDGISDDGAEPDNSELSSVPGHNPRFDAAYCGGISDVSDDYPVCRFCGQPLFLLAGVDEYHDIYCDALCEQRAIHEGEDGK
jgi:hypothetical protein